MDRWLAISDGATAALHALAFATSRGGLVSSKAIAEELSVSPSYLAKLIQDLSRAELVETVRGVGGGVGLKGDPSKVSCLEVVTAIDGPLPARACLFPDASCTKGSCAFKVLCAEIGAKARKVLESTSLLDLSRSY